MFFTIHDARLRIVGFIDNAKQETLNYSKAQWHRYLINGSSTLDLTIVKKQLGIDIGQQRLYQTLNEKAFISFEYKGKTYLHSVVSVSENEREIECSCINLNLELTNESVDAYTSPRAMSFAEYLEAFTIHNSGLVIGVNEVAEKRISAEWQGQDTKLNRLLSLVNKFDAELEFETLLNTDGTLKRYILNVYRKRDENYSGVGRTREDIILVYNQNIKTITREVDKSGIVNAIRPIGKDGVTIDHASKPTNYKFYNSDGVLEFFQESELLYAPISAEMFPPIFGSPDDKDDDRWITKDFKVESDDPDVVRSAGLRHLKSQAYPSITYKVDGVVDSEIGDVVKIQDEGFLPTLLLEARVSEQVIDFVRPSQNKTVFDNFKALESKVSPMLQSRLEQLLEDAKPYTIKLSTDNGVVFKNQVGESLVTPTLYKGGKPVTAGVTWRWSLDGEVTTGMTYLVRGSNVTDTVTLTVAAYIGNDEVAVDEISLVNVSDGKSGKDGRDGVDGAKGDKGDKGDKGERGERGLQGLQGAKGDQGIAGERGADGRTQYTHIAYADNATGGGFSQTNTDKPYIGMYVDFTATDSTNPTAYKWTKWKGEDGAQGIPGPKGDDGRTPYVHFAYANSLDGRTDFSNTDSADKRYIGIYTDYIQADSTDPTKYRWRDSIGTAIENKLNEKADQVLTQEQLNALNEKNQILEAEMKAKASMEAFSELEKAYNDFVEKNAEGVAQSEKDLIEAGRRIDLLTTQFGGLSELKTFIDTYMKSSNEGLIIGKNDASSTIKVSSDRISMFSAGREVMYISQGVIHIDNGIFTASVQVGRFRTEQYHLNADMNVIRYVG